MRHCVILGDVGGYTERLRAIQDAARHFSSFEVVGISPPDKRAPGFEPVEIPENWLPLREELPQGGGLSMPRRYWRKSTYHSIAAIGSLGLQADAFWQIESDCVASQARWEALFADHLENPDDLSTTCLGNRLSLPKNRWWASTPEWADLCHIGAIHRISSRAVGWVEESAEEMREVFGEFCLASVVCRAGGTLGRINRSVVHLDNQTIKSNPRPNLWRSDRICHPVKANTYALPT